MAGYSGPPLVRKLGIKAGATLYLANAPENYRQLVSPFAKFINGMCTAIATCCVTG